jgi:hypothetical protein
MTKGKAITLAVFTLWPFLVIATGLLFELTGMIPMDAAKPPAVFVLLLALLYLTPLVVLALLIFYLVFLFTRVQLPLDWKLVWAALLVIGHVFTMPVFWYLHVWKPRTSAPMQAPSRFSLLVFSPLLIVLLLPLIYMLPMTIFFTANQSALQWVWVIGPVLGAACIFIVGRLCYLWLKRDSSPPVAWTLIWGVFSVQSLPVIWYATIVLRGMLPSDAPPNTLRDLTRIALVLAVVAQPFVLGWLVAISRLRWIRKEMGKLDEHIS